MITHFLKTWPIYFEAIVRGEKNFEIRENTDRGFQKGDTVLFLEYQPEKQICSDPIPIEVLSGFTGRERKAKIRYVTNFQQKENFVVFGFMLEESDGTQT